MEATLDGRYLQETIITTIIVAERSERIVLARNSENVEIENAAVDDEEDEPDLSSIEDCKVRY